ncbi:universal stress protein [Neolewinella lacunae]|uniref:Universal stress protein n=1 Tax=Neolewinella lacunae TaxID=1517758 RepID=A0A923PLW3_9BACT|nr:universal stress protein [Neolewinella lacunae]MBC6995121.1 universal stress protein [Neolewinella lacunae]MDN3634071.1 universal stress protein [Neolewinella lacunae]
MQKIIVPIDFSGTSADALRFGCYLADVTGYDLEAVHIHDGYDGDEAFVIKKGSARIRGRVRERLEKFVAEHTDAQTFTGSLGADGDLPFIKCREEVGSAIAQLVRLGKEEDTALIVMGGVGSGIPSRVTPVFGSVAKGVATQAECPVLLVPQNAGVPQIKQAAIAFDEVRNLVVLSDKTAFLQKGLAPHMRFTHVLYHGESASEVPELNLLREVLRKDFPHYAVDFDLLPPGNVTDTLIDYSLERDIDLLILGRHQRSFFDLLINGSEIPEIIGSCGIPLLIVPLTGEI